MVADVSIIEPTARSSQPSDLVSAFQLGDVERIGRIFNTPLSGSYTWNYEEADARIAKLYRLGKERNWDARLALDWKRNIPREQWPQYGEGKEVGPCPFRGFEPYEALPRADRIEFAWHMLSWTISQFLHGEQGALLIASQLVSCAPTYDGKLYASSQTFDEARHVEVFSRYLRTHVGFMYPVNPQLKALLDKILGDARWDLKFVGMQLIIESLALAAFQVQREISFDPLMKQIIDLVVGDEARHVAFGVTYLEQFIRGLPPADVEARAQFAYEACCVMRDSIVPRDVLRHFGLDEEAGAKFFLEAGELGRFRDLLFARILPNLKRVGLLPESVKPQYDKLGLWQLSYLPDDSCIDWAKLGWRE